MTNVKTLRLNLIKEEETKSLWTRNEDYPLLLMDKCNDSFTTRQRGYELARHRRAKKNEPTYSFLHRKALDFASRRVSLRKGIDTPPYLTRGSKGYILEDAFMDLLPKAQKTQSYEAKEQFNSSMVLFGETFLMLPPEYIKYLK